MSADQTPRLPGPRGGMPQSFALLLVFGLLAAGIITLAGFAIDKRDDKDASEAREPANAAAAQLYEEGLFTPTEDEKTAEVMIGVLDEDSDVVEEPDGETDGDATGEAPEADLDDPDALLAAGDASTGQSLFFANSCQTCHGENGEGLVGPTIAQTSLTLSQVVGQYRTPRGIMPAFSADVVSDQDVAHIYTWLQTLDLPDVIMEGLGTP